MAKEEYDIYKPWWRWLLMMGLFIIIGLGVLFHIVVNSG